MVVKEFEWTKAVVSRDGAEGYRQSKPGQSRRSSRRVGC